MPRSIWKCCYSTIEYFIRTLHVPWRVVDFKILAYRLLWMEYICRYIGNWNQRKLTIYLVFYLPLCQKKGIYSIADCCNCDTESWNLSSHWQSKSNIKWTLIVHCNCNRTTLPINDYNCITQAWKHFVFIADMPTTGALIMFTRNYTWTK